MEKQQNYDFRKEMLQKQKPGMRDFGFVPEEDMVEVTKAYTIVIPEAAGEVLEVGAQDLKEYLFTSMKVSLRLVRSEDPTGIPAPHILVGTWEQLGKTWEHREIGASYEITVEQDQIVVCGFDERGCAQGCYWLEDQMSNCRAPYLKPEKTYYAPAFSPRMVHTGYGAGEYPDAHLLSIARAGMDAILTNVQDESKGAAVYSRLNDLIGRAARYGLDVYAYSHYKSDLHPEDAGAFEHYDASYGNLFRRCPGLKGIILVGESVEFPSKDPRVSKFKYYNNTVDGLPTGKITAGWFPCNDYYKWIQMLKDVIYPHKPDADIVFWTYNWGFQPEEDRLKLIDSLPTDISLMVTFEMFETRKVDDTVSAAADYTISFPEPGKYFLSEAKRAKERGIRLYSQANSCGGTWDFGVIPYNPCPEKWTLRYERMLEAKENYGLCGIMESHDYGFWPSFVSRIEKLMFTEYSREGEREAKLHLSGEQAIAKIAEEYYGKEHLEAAKKAWHLLSEAYTYYISSDEDQYGPFRIGPSYPFILGRHVQIPSVPYAVAGGNAICSIDYGAGYGTNYYRRAAGLPQQRLPGEIGCLHKMKDLLAEGRKELENLADTLEGLRREETLRLINMLQFMEHTVVTGIHIKMWVLRKWKLHCLTDPKELLTIVEEMIEIAKAELKNAEETIPIVEADSRLGWTSSTEYIGDARHIRWKIKQLTQVLEWELSGYRELFEKQLDDINKRK